MPTSDWLLGRDAQVDHYRVIRSLGRGSTAEVYLARDESLGRKVALKVIRPEALGSQEAVERSLREARATAKFNHPHIVTIYAVGESDGRPYLALEYLEGESLRERLTGELPAAPEAIRIGLAIAEALNDAHQAEVLHRDLKPENVIMAKDGRPRVLDFGLAGFKRTEETKLPSQPGATSSQGTPGYMAPEQWQGTGTTGATDVWALGVILHELIVGCRPIEESSLVEQAARVCDAEPVPRIDSTLDIRPDLVDLVSRCLEKDASARPSSKEVTQELRRMLVIDRDEGAQEESPFRGLMAFHEQHRHFFFGRETEIAACAERLRIQPVLPLVGPSGAGKSSLVQAGLIPRLRERGPLVVLQLRPGSDPFRALALRIVAARKQATGYDTGEDPDAQRLGDQLTASPTLLNIMLHRLAERRRSTVLLFVDQLEELVTLVPDEETRRGFMQAICSAADDPEMPVRVVLTLREEFLSRLAVGPGVRDALGQVTVLRSPGPEALKEIVSEPLRLVGYDYDDPDLPGDMVAEVQGEASCLPLLQFAGSMLWQRRDKAGRHLNRSVYQDMGGVVGALAKHADGVLSGMSQDEIALARSLLLRLVTDEGTRRVLSREDLLDGLAPGAGDVLSRLTEARLVTSRQSEDEGLSRLELVHESLVVTWGRLARWIDESSDELRFLNEVGQAAELWAKRGHRDEEAWQGRTLYDAEKAIEQCTTDVSSHIKRFLAASRRKERRRIWRRRGILATAFALLATIAVVFIVKERETGKERDRAEGMQKEAESQRDVALRRQALALREGARAAMERQDPLTARAMLRESIEHIDSANSRAIWWRLSKEPLLFKKSGIAGHIAFSPDGHEIAVGWEPDRIAIIDARTSEIRRVLTHPGRLYEPHYSPDGQFLAISAWDGSIHLYRRDTGELVRSWPMKGRVREFARFSPGSTRLAVDQLDRSIKVLDVKTGAVAGVVRRPTNADQAKKVDFPKGRFCFAGDDHILARDLFWEREDRARVCKWNIKTGQVAKELVRWDPRKERWFKVTDVWGRGHGLFAVWRPLDEPTRLYDMHTGELRYELPFAYLSNPWYGLAVEPSHRHLVVATGGMFNLDHGIERWDLKTGQRLSVFPGNYEFLAISLADSKIASLGSDATVVLRSDRIQPPPTVRPLLNEGSVVRLAGKDGGQLVVHHRDEKLRLWDTLSARFQADLYDEEKIPGIRRFGLSPNAQLIVTDRSPGIHRMNSGKLEVSLERSQALRSLEFLGDGSLLGGHAYSGPRGEMEYRVWKAKDGRLVRSVPSARTAFTSRPGMTHARVSPKGDLEVYELRTGKLQRTFSGLGQAASGRGSPVRFTELSPDGRYLGVFGEDDFWMADIKTGHKKHFRYRDFGWPEERPRGRLKKYWILPGNRRVVVVYSEASLRFAVWDLEQKKTVVGPVAVPPTSTWFPVDDGPVGDYLLFAAIEEFASSSGVVRIYNLTDGRPIWRGPVLLSQGPSLLTHTGWLNLESGKPIDLAADTTEPWQNLTKEARIARESPDGRTLCVLRWDGGLEFWNLSTRERVHATEPRDIKEIAATTAGCVTLTNNGSAELLRADQPEPVKLVASGALALWAQAKTIHVTTRNSLLDFSNDGQALGETTLDGEKASAICLAWDRVVVGRSDGRVVVSGAPDDTLVVLREVPGFRAVRLIPGPMGTVIAGFEDGTVGLWELSTGAHLYSDRLHGLAVHLLLHDKKLYAASELGDHLVWDLQYFYQDYCSLLQEVWDEVEVAIEGGNVVLRPASDDHRCRKAAKEGS